MNTSSQKGVTLILLTITVIILAILAGVVLQISTTNDPLIKIANKQKQKYNVKQIEEKFLSIYFEKYNFVSSTSTKDDIEADVASLVINEFQNEIKKIDDRIVIMYENSNNRYIVKDKLGNIIYEYTPEKR